MSHFCTSKMEFLRTDWFPSKTNALIKHMRPRDLTAVHVYIDQFFEAHVQDSANEVGVAKNCPDPWPSVLAPIWIAADMDEERAGMFLGNLYCRHAIQRPEEWWSFPDAVLPWKPRKYVVKHHLP
jgi:hypothetical protein